MERPVDRADVEKFYEAFAARDAVRMAPLLDDNVEWTISGPVDLLLFCGTRRGKQAVLDLISRKSPHHFDIRRFERSAVLVDGDRAAMLSRLSGTSYEGGRAISYRVAQFLRFRDQKLVEYCSVIDSFDAVEQVTGLRLCTKEYSRQKQTGDVYVV